MRLRYRMIFPLKKMHPVCVFVEIKNITFKNKKQENKKVEIRRDLHIQY